MDKARPKLGAQWKVQRDKTKEPSEKVEGRPGAKATRATREREVDVEDGCCRWPESTAQTRARQKGCHVLLPIPGFISHGHT